MSTLKVKPGTVLSVLDLWAGWMLFFIALSVQKGSLALMAMTSALELGNCHLTRAHMVLYCSHSSSREVASLHCFPRNRFSTAAQSSALHSTTAHTGSCLYEDPIAWECAQISQMPVPELRGHLGGELCLSLHPCWQWQQQRTGRRFTTLLHSGSLLARDFVAWPLKSGIVWICF